MRDTSGQARGYHPENLVGYSFIIKGKVGRGKRPPSSLFFESSIINSFYTLGGGVFDPIRPCHGTMEVNKKVVTYIKIW